MHKDQGDLTEAMELLEQAKAIHEQVHGPQHPSVANDFYGLACVHCLSGRNDLALEHMGRAVASGLAAFSLEHILTNHDLDVIREDTRFKVLFPP